MPIMLCPNCNTGVQQVTREGVQLDVCPQCKGVWLDRGELDKLLRTARDAEAELDRDRPRRRHRDDDERDDDERDDDERGEGRPRRRGRLSRVFDLFGGESD